MLNIFLKIGNRSVTLGHKCTYRIVSTEGLEAGDYRLLLSENALLDGARVDGFRTLPRTVKLVFDVVCDDPNGVHRASLLSFFHPASEGVMTVTRNSCRRQIGCRVSALSFRQQTAYQPLRVSVSLLCPDPFFTDAEDKTASIDTSAPLLFFPLTSLKGFGVSAGAAARSYDIVIDNTGDLPIGVRAVFTVRNGMTGSVQNPGIVCGGEGVKLLDTLTAGDEAVISTCPGSKKILKNGENSYLFSRTSIFFEIPAGKSTVTFTADSGKTLLSGTVSYRCRYLGI